MARKFVFFDVGSTLLFANRDRMLQPLYERGIVPSEKDLRALECIVKNEFDDILEHDGRADHGFWDMFYMRLFEKHQLSDEPLRQRLIANTRDSSNWDQMRPGTRDALERIAARHQIAVISNADGKIAELLGRCGIADCFRTITDSGIVGHEKPHPRIYLGGASERAMQAAARFADVYLMWGEPVELMAERAAQAKAMAAELGRTLEVGTRFQIVCRETDDQARADAEDIVASISDTYRDYIRGFTEKTDSVGQLRQNALLERCAWRDDCL